MLRDDLDLFAEVFRENGWRQTLIDIIGMAALALVMFAFVTLGLMAVPA